MPCNRNLEALDLTNPPIDPGQRQFKQHPDAAFREVGQDIFLVHPDGEAIYNLNPTAAAIWRLMEQGLSVDEMADVIAAAYPVMSMDRIRSDIEAVLAELVDQGFARTDSDD